MSETGVIVKFELSAIVRTDAVRPVSFLGAVASVLALSTLAIAQDVPDYRDDRSDPRALVESLYSAIARKEYARAFSYFDEDAVSDFQTFEDGYSETASVRMKVGEVTGEGAAGSLYGSVPVVVEAVATNGTISVFTGCYETRQAQPASQVEPPFSPIRIIAGELEASGAAFEAASASCPEEGL